MRNFKGSSLVEVMIAAGVMAGLSLVISKMGIMGVESTKKVEQRFDLSTIQNEIQGILMTPQICQENFQGLDPAVENAISSIKFNGIDKYIVDATNDSSSRAIIKSIKFGGLYNALPGTPNTGETVLKIQYAGKQLGSQELSLGTKNISLIVTKNATGDVEGCNTFSTTYQGLWSVDQGTKNIYYNTANVGIGTGEPTEKLSILGNMNATGDISISGTASSSMVFTQSAGINVAAPTAALDVLGNFNLVGNMTSIGNYSNTGTMTNTGNIQSTAGHVLGTRIGANNVNPLTVLHAKSDAAIARFEGITHEYIEFYRNGARSAWIGFGGAGQNIMSLNNDRGGTIRFGSNGTETYGNALITGSSTTNGNARVVGNVRAENGVDVAAGQLTVRGCTTVTITQSLGAGWSYQTFVLPGAGTGDWYYKYCGSGLRPVTSYCSIGIPNDYGWPGDFHKINTYKNGIDSNGWAWCGVYNQSGGTTVTKVHNVRCCPVNYW